MQQLVGHHPINAPSTFPSRGLTNGKGDAAKGPQAILNMHVDLNEMLEFPSQVSSTSGGEPPHVKPRQPHQPPKSSIMLEDLPQLDILVGTQKTRKSSITLATHQRYTFLPIKRDRNQLFGQGNRRPTGTCCEKVAL